MSDSCYTYLEYGIPRRRNKENHKKWVYNWQKNNKESRKLTVFKCKLKREFNMNIIKYVKMIESQNNCCKRCMKSFKKTSPIMNLSKDRKKILNLICRSCHVMKMNKIRLSKKKE